MGTPDYYLTLASYFREYYFSSDNLQRDFFLRRKMSAEGYLPISLIASFNRVQQLTQVDVWLCFCVSLLTISFPSLSLCPLPPHHFSVSLLPLSLSLRIYLYALFNQIFSSRSITVFLSASVCLSVCVTLFSWGLSALVLNSTGFSSIQSVLSVNLCLSAPICL